MDVSLDVVAAEAEEVADEQRQVARQARSMQRRRDRGASWAAVLDAQSAPALLERLRRSARRLTGATGAATRILVAGLIGEGESRRQIARRLGVSHQRVSAILNRTPRSNRSDAS